MTSTNIAEGAAQALTQNEDLRSSSPKSDPMLLCMALVAKLLDMSVHLPALRSGFPVDEQGLIPLASYPDMAARNGLIAGWSTMSVEDVPPYVMPVIVPLHDGRACVLKSVAKGKATVLWAESGLMENVVPVEQLQALAKSDVLVVKAAPKRNDGTLAPLQGEAFNWFWGTLWRFRGFYVESMLATVLANILTLATVFFTMNVYDRVVPTQAYASLWTLAIGASIAVFFEFVMRWLKARLVDLGGKKADLAINATLLREIMAIRLEHRPQSVGVFSSSMRDFDALRDFFSSASLVVVAELPFVIMFLALIGIIAGPLAIVPAIAVPLLIIVGLLVQRPLMQAMRENMKEAGDKQSVLVESLMNMELLKAHNAEGYLQRRWEASNLAGSNSYKKMRSITNWILGLTTASTQWVTIVMVVYGVYLIHANQLTQGGLIASVILAGRALGPLGSIMGLAARYQQAASSLETLDGLMKRPRDRDHTRSYIAPEIHGAIEAEDIEFAYPGEHKIPAIRRISLKIPVGGRLALIGRVGSGKSTLLRILSGLYTPNAGNVRVDGIDVRQIEPAHLRGRIGYVGQDPQLFFGTLRENLVLSDGWISDAKIIETLKAFNTYDIVSNHPLGLDMMITESGGGLSGGQRQLLAIIRMVLRDPCIVFMDEPTSNMDQGTETRVINFIRNWIEGKTLVVSTHRPQLLEWAKEVALIESGRCAAMGSTEEMLERLAQGISVKEARKTAITS